MSRTRSSCLLAAAVFGFAAAGANAAIYDAAIQATPGLMSYYRFENTGASNANDKLVLPLANTQYSYDWTNPGASVTTVFGNSSTLRPSSGYLGMSLDNDAATFGANTIVSNLDVNNGTTGNSTTHKNNVKSAVIPLPTGGGGLNGAAAITVSAWVKASDLTPGTTNGTYTQTIASVVISGAAATSTSASTGLQLNLQSTISGGVRTFSGFHIGGRSRNAGVEASFSAATMAFPAGMTDDTWYNIVGVFDYDNKEVSVYVDGTEVGTAAIAAWSGDPLAFSATPPDRAGVVTIGAIYNSLNAAGTGRDTTANGQQFLGQLDEVAIFNTELTPTQIQNLYLAALPEPASLSVIAGMATLALRRRR